MTPENKEGPMTPGNENDDNEFDVNDTDNNGEDENGANSGRVLSFDIRHLSAEQFGKLGVAQIAYVKPVMHNGAAAFAIHAADGTPMAIATDQALAFAAIVQHRMVPAMVQ
jgi:hypothetical protein